MEMELWFPVFLAPRIESQVDVSAEISDDDTGRRNLPFLSARLYAMDVIVNEPIF